MLLLDTNENFEIVHLQEDFVSITHFLGAKMINFTGIRYKEILEGLPELADSTLILDHYLFEREDYKCNVLASLLAFFWNRNVL